MTMNDLKPTGSSLPRAGKIRLGYMVPNKSGSGEHPEEADHLVLKDVPEVAKWARKELGTDEPRALPIWIPFNEVEECLPGFYKLYLSSGLWCKGDGTKIIYSVNKTTGKPDIRDGRVVSPLSMNGQGSEFLPGQEVPCPGRSTENRWKRCQYCGPQMTFIFMVRGLPVEDLRLATYHVESRSVNNYPTLYERLSYFTEKYGRLQGIPFILCRVQREIGITNLNKDGSRKRAPGGALLPAKTRMKKWLLDLEVDPAWIAQMMIKDEQLADPMREVTPQLESGANVIEMPTDEAAIVNFNDAGDYVKFCHRVMKEVPFYGNCAEIEAALDDMGYKYKPEDEEFLRQGLDSYAQEMADGLADDTPAQTPPQEVE